METEWMHNFKIRCITSCCIILPIKKTQLALFMQEMNQTALFVLCCFLMTLYSLLMITTESLFLNYLNVCHSFCIFTLHLQTNMGQWHTYVEIAYWHLHLMILVAILPFCNVQHLHVYLGMWSVWKVPQMPLNLFIKLHWS